MGQMSTDSIPACCLTRTCNNTQQGVVKIWSIIRNDAKVKFAVLFCLVAFFSSTEFVNVGVQKEKPCLNF